MRTQTFEVKIHIADDDQTDVEDTRDIVEEALRTRFKEFESMYGSEPWPEAFEVKHTGGV